MNPTKKQPAYFVKPGRQNTDRLLRLVKGYIDKERINNVVISSSTGETEVKAGETFKRANVVVVTHHHGFQQPGKHELSETFGKRDHS